ncbi:hypothetical protein BB561_006138, partial [Smittium simulii]
SKLECIESLDFPMNKKLFRFKERIIIGSKKNAIVIKIPSYMIENELAKTGMKGYQIESELLMFFEERVLIIITMNIIPRIDPIETQNRYPNHM